MKASETALNLIRQFEGFRAKPYRCPANHLTIGFGHVLRPDEILKSISRREADKLLLRDIKLVIAALKRLIVVPLHQHQLDALICFVFNIGPGGFQRSRLRRCVNRGHHSYVPQEFMKWVRSNGKVLPGLIRRRSIEASLYQGSLSAVQD